MFLKFILFYILAHRLFQLFQGMCIYDISCLVKHIITVWELARLALSMWLTQDEKVVATSHS